MENILLKNHSSVRHYIASAVIIVVLISWIGVLDISSAEYIDGSIVQASVAFASARALNALVSVAQSTEISVMIASLKIGEALDPINDLVEQYSTLMQYAIASLFLQKFLLTITSNVVFKILLTITALIAVSAAFLSQQRYYLLSVKAFLLLAFLRFALVLVVILNGLVNQFFINAQIDQDISDIQAAAEEVREASEEHQIAPALRVELESQLQGLTERRDEIISNKKRLEGQLAQKKVNLVNTQEELSKIEKQIDLTKKFNFFNRDENHAKAIKERDLAAAEVAEVEDQISELDRVLRDNENQQIAVKNSLEGQTNSLFDAVSNATSKIASGAKEQFTGKVSALVDRLNNSVMNMLNLMTAFLLKTLILPLLFLYMIVQITKALWHIDLREYDPAKLVT